MAVKRLCFKATKAYQNIRAKFCLLAFNQKYVLLLQLWKSTEDLKKKKKPYLLTRMYFSVELFLLLLIGYAKVQADALHSQIQISLSKDLESH